MLVLGAVAHLVAAALEGAVIMVEAAAEGILPMVPEAAEAEALQYL
jgi:hypothetical protein